MHTLGQGESRDGPIGTLGRSGRRLRTNRSAAVLGCCKNLRLSYSADDSSEKVLVVDVARCDNPQMHVDLRDLNADVWDRVQGPDGVAYFQQSSRLKRSQVDELIAAGPPLVVSWFGGGELDWFDERDALAAWHKRRRLFTAHPTASTSKHMQWTGGVFRTQDLERSIIVLTGHC